ncbi:MAG: CoA-binding protein [Chloroflexota bacterium]
METTVVQQVRSILEPRSIAVIGAGEDRKRWTGRMIFSPLNTGYKGAIYPVNPNRDTVFGLKAYRSILDVPGQVDLAVIVVPVQLTPGVMRECVKHGVKGAVIITAGFAEVGEEGKSIQDEVVRIAHEGGIRFVGPNCAGIYSSAARLNLSIHSALPGHIAFVSQSGTLGGYLFQYASSKGYGLSKFVSAGNQASLNMSDYLEYLAQDNDTKAIVLYIEGIKEGRRFLDVAREVVKKKPIVVFKGGKSGPGTRAARSHTASLSGSDAVFDAVCKQAGIIRCDECFHPLN